MVYFGIDFGTKRIGLAVGQDTTQQARPLCILQNNSQFFSELKKLIDEWRPKAIVLGMPSNPDHADKKTEKAATAFKNKLEQETQLPIHTIDEHLSSFEARVRAKELQIKVDKVDALAAAIILESWLVSQNQL